MNDGRPAAAFSAHGPAGRRALERGLARIRWFGVGFGAFQLWQDALQPARPGYLIPLGFALVAFLGAGNVALWRLARRASDERLPRVALGGFALDAVVIFGFAWLYSYDPATQIWVLGYILPLEAALRWGLPGAVATIVLAAASELARELYIVATIPGTKLFVGSVTFRVGVLAIIALVAGFMARSLQQRAVAAEREARTFERLAEHEREALERLRKLDEMRDLFLQAVSHELRTPLTSVLGYALTLEHQDLSPAETRESLSRMASSARKLDALLKDLLDLDRLGRGTLGLQRRTTDVAALVRRVVADANLDGRDVHLDLAPVVVDVDPAKIERIVDNLVANAAKHTPLGTPVWVRASETPEGLMILVEDGGPGVDDAMKADVFEAFRQGDTPAHAPGTGIGLSLVERFAELHGGRAWVEDREGGGASFRVLLPGGSASERAAERVSPEGLAAAQPQSLS